MEILFTKRQGGWKEKGKSNKGNKMENLVQCLDNFNTKALQWLQCRQDNLVWVVWEAIWIGYTVKRKTNFLWVLSCHHTTATEIRSIKEDKVVNNRIIHFIGCVRKFKIEQPTKGYFEFSKEWIFLIFKICFLDSNLILLTGVKIYHKITPIQVSNTEQGKFVTF